LMMLYLIYWRVNVNYNVLKYRLVYSFKKEMWRFYF
jgi:hypothetical protein